MKYSPPPKIMVEILAGILEIINHEAAKQLTDCAEITITPKPQFTLVITCHFRDWTSWELLEQLLNQPTKQLIDQTKIKWELSFFQLWNREQLFVLLDRFLTAKYPKNLFKKNFNLSQIKIIDQQEIVFEVNDNDTYQHFNLIASDLQKLLSSLFASPIKTRAITTSQPSFAPNNQSPKQLTDNDQKNNPFDANNNQFQVWKVTIEPNHKSHPTIVEIKNDHHFYSCYLDSKLRTQKKVEQLFANPTIIPVFGQKKVNPYVRQNVDRYLVDFTIVDQKPDSKVESNPDFSQLFLHTKASTQDGLFYYQDFGELAQKLGHQSLAITDWNAVTEYPKVEQWAKKLGIKPIYGVELEVIADQISTVVNSEQNQQTIAEATYCIFDIETTGLNGAIDHIIEIACHKYHNDELIDQFHCLITTPRPLPPHITQLTTITNQQLNQAGIPIITALQQFVAFVKNTVLVAHNGISFDLPFINARLVANGLAPINNCLVDTMQLSKALFFQKRSHNLAALLNHLGLQYDENQAHRANQDVIYTKAAFFKLLQHFPDYQLPTNRPWSEFHYHDKKMVHEFTKKNPTTKICVYAKNQAGIKSIYQLLSYAHTEFFLRFPTVSWTKINQLRANLIITNSPDQSDLWQAVTMNNVVSFQRLVQNYDYVLIPPPSGYLHQISRGGYVLSDYQKLIQIFYHLTIANGKKPIANKVVKYLQQENQVQYNALVHGKMIGGRPHPLYHPQGENQVLPDYQYTTSDQLAAEFSFLNLSAVELKAFIIDHNRFLVSQIEDNLVIINKQLHPPILPDGENQLLTLTKKRLEEKYGSNPNPLIVERLEKELNAIIKHGFSIIYWASYLLVKKSIADGYLVGSRGSVGSSFIAYLVEITEVNPLPPHYYCQQCHYTEFVLEFPNSGFDLPPTNCSNCQITICGDGHNIPFATFIGFDGDKIPDIDLNFSGEYQGQAHNYLKTLFGSEYCYRSGTVSTIADKTAYGFAKNYLELSKTKQTYGLINWITNQITDVRRTSGQHPGGILVIPNNLSVYDFTPVNYPADDLESEWKTTHIPYEYLHDCLIKFDVLGHDDPTILKKLHILTKKDPRKIPNHDPKVLKMFTDCQVINVKSEQILNEQTGAIGLPEFGTNFVRKILVDAKPNSFGDLIRISGLSHGTDVWRGNAENLIKKNKLKLNEIISCRDDIMVGLINNYQVEPLVAFNIMESVRKGNKIPKKFIPMLKKKDVPDWYLKSADSIKYMFPKAHAAAYVLMAWRVAYYKYYYPTEYYATYFSIRSDNFDLSTLITNDPKIIQLRYDEINKLMKSKKISEQKLVKTKDKNLLVIYEVVLEMLARNIRFVPINPLKSAATEFIPVGEKEILIPFIAVDGLGKVAANKIINEREQSIFNSKKDFISRTNLSKKIIQKMEELKLLDQLNHINPYSLFDLKH